MCSSDLRNGIYHFRIAIPLYLKPYFGNKTEYTNSTRTKRYDLAKNHAKIYSRIFSMIKKAAKMNLGSEFIERVRVVTGEAGNGLPLFIGRFPLLLRVAPFFH